MTIEQQKENSPKFKEISWVSEQVKQELKRFNKEKFYEKNGEEIVYNMDTVKQYLWVLKNKKTWKELISKNSSAMIMAVQIALYSQNYSFWNIDWILWDKTKSAIRKFQADNNLPVDTYWRSVPSTIQKLLEVISREDQIEIPQEEKKEAEEIMEEKENKEQIKKQSEEKPTLIVEPHVKPTTHEPTLDETTQKEWWENNSVFYKPDENMEWINAEETIRPEIQALIDSYNWNGEHFKNIKELTKAEAKAINKLHRAAWQYLYFSSLENIHPAALDELMKHNSGMELWLKTLSKEQAQKLEGFKYGINFNNLTTLDISVVKSLAKTEWKLEFSALKQLSPEIIEAFSGRLFGDIVFKTVDKLDIQTAEKLVQIEYQWKIYLNGIKEISLEVVKVLAQKPKRFVLNKLDGKKPLSNEILDILSKFSYLQLNTYVVDQIEAYKKRKKIEGKQLTEPILELYNSNFRNMDSLKNITSLSYDDAVLLAQSWRSLDLSWIKKFDPDVFEALMKTQSSITLGLEEFSETLAKKVEGRTYGLIFKNLKTLEPKVAESLSHSHWELKLDAVENITPETAKFLAWKWWGNLISLNWIKKEDPQVFEAFNNFSGNVTFNGIQEISEESIKVLEKKTKWTISLTWLKAPLDENIIECLSKVPTQVFSRNGLNNEIFSQIYNYKKQKEEKEKSEK